MAGGALVWCAVGDQREQLVEFVARYQELRDQHDHRADEERQQDDGQRDRQERPGTGEPARAQPVRARRSGAGHATTFVDGARPDGSRPSPPVAIRSPTAFLSAVGPSTTATIRPSYMTPIRSDSSSTSSSSAETRRTAVPASRLAITWRWMNSMLPTARPSVGWSRISSLSARSNSRATTAFCWLPPDRVPARTFGDGVRMSNRPIADAASFWIASWLRRSPRAYGER